MLTLSSITPIDPPVLICKVKSLDELEDKIYACSQTCFTGWLVLDGGETDDLNWKLFSVGAVSLAVSEELIPYVAGIGKLCSTAHS